MATMSDTFSASVYLSNGGIVIKSFNTHGEARRFGEFDKTIVKIVKNVNHEEIVIFSRPVEDKMIGFYEFRQTNSGGSIYVSNEEGIGEYVYFQAASPEEANTRASKIGLFGLPYCECCGDRFYSLSDYDEPLNDGSSISLFSLEKTINMFVHMLDGTIHHMVIQNNLRGNKVEGVWKTQSLLAATA